MNHHKGANVQGAHPPHYVLAYATIIFVSAFGVHAFFQLLPRFDFLGLWPAFAFLAICFLGSPVGTYTPTPLQVQNIENYVKVNFVV